MYYLNTDMPLRLFAKARNSKIYVDKSLLINKVSERIATMDLSKCYPALKEQEYYGISQMFRDTGDSFIFMMSGISYFISISYSKKDKKHTCRIEKWNCI